MEPTKYLHEILAQLSHEDLYRMRQSAPSYMQEVLAPAEHAAFAREWTKENPAIAAPSLAVAIPAYSLAKAVGLQKARTPASLDEFFAGYEGILQGLTSK